jgi:hypothetical protein
MDTHLSADQAAQVLRLMASGAVSVRLAPQARGMQQIAVGELELHVDLPDLGLARAILFINCGDLSHTVSMQLPVQRATLGTWLAHGQEDPLSLLLDYELSDLEHVLQQTV